MSGLLTIKEERNDYCVTMTQAIGELTTAMPITIHAVTGHSHHTKPPFSPIGARSSFQLAAEQRRCTGYSLCPPLPPLSSEPQNQAPTRMGLGCLKTFVYNSVAGESRSAHHELPLIFLPFILLPFILLPLQPSQIVLQEPSRTLGDHPVALRKSKKRTYSRHNHACYQCRDCS